MVSSPSRETWIEISFNGRVSPAAQVVSLAGDVDRNIECGHAIIGNRPGVCHARGVESR